MFRLVLILVLNTGKFKYLAYDIIRAAVKSLGNRDEDLIFSAVFQWGQALLKENLLEIFQEFTRLTGLMFCWLYNC